MEPAGLGCCLWVLPACSHTPPHLHAHHHAQFLSARESALGTPPKGRRAWRARSTCCAQHAATPWPAQTSAALLRALSDRNGRHTLPQQAHLLRPVLLPCPHPAMHLHSKWITFTASKPHLLSRLLNR